MVGSGCGGGPGLVEYQVDGSTGVVGFKGVVGSRGGGNLRVVGI